MFTPAMILANAKINELQAEAAAQRLAKKSRKARSTSLLDNVRSFFSGPFDGSISLPKLVDYPYRS
jgi:hypothetical protein